ncbi:DUF1592 domain-containing protein [Tautonia sociabilis]|uniref:DUF1592 domain-containing protein n=1 Tax=Tautonia sociabilis TaxID=2080755 RepID=A0A432MFC4_9BACT|nr:DUF1592 domain-containing protein [Tautonia sociabilis]RUL84894.1 DUF1592 domain-containing protein [Tautonia sociabilis]
MRTRTLFRGGAAILGGLLALSGGPVGGMQDDRSAFEEIAEDFERLARPVLRDYCLECHETEIAEGEVDLEAIEGIDGIRAEIRTWQRVGNVLDLGEMPPEGSVPLPDEERARLSGWIDRLLRLEAQAHAGDPGPVVLRRLTNAQFEHTILDLTGLSLDLTREFPTDGAAGEGFTNSGNALVMSPSLLEKFFEAAKKVADHAVLLPDGFRFSPGSSRRDWTDEAVDRIRSFYSRFTEEGDGTQVNLQGIVFETNGGGRLPLERSLAALLEGRDAIRDGTLSPEQQAEARGLSPRYLRLLWEALEGNPRPSIVMTPLQASWQAAGEDGAEEIADRIRPWQETLWRFNSVGHIGKVGGPTRWMEPMSPLVERQEVRVSLPEDRTAPEEEVRLFLSVTDAGDGAEHDVAVWERPRLVTPGRPDLPLRNLRAVARHLDARRAEALELAVACLDAASESLRSPGPVDIAATADRLGIPADVLGAWFGYLGIGGGAPTIPPEAILSAPIQSVGGYDFVGGWGSPDTPNVIANRSDEQVRVPGTMLPHSVAMHPSPGLRVAAGWRSPVDGTIRVGARVQHAHPECGNGVTWLVELRTAGTRRRLASGGVGEITPVDVGPIEGLAVRRGDLVVLSIGPRDGNHACDLTTVNLTLSDGRHSWDLAGDVSPDIASGNPHADRLGNEAVWAFFTEPDDETSTDALIPSGSLLGRWQDASDPDARHRLARQIGALLASDPPSDEESPNAILRRQLSALRGPLLSRLASSDRADLDSGARGPGAVGLDPGLFGLDPDGRSIDPLDLCVRPGTVLEVRIPAELAAGSSFEATGRLLSGPGEEGSVQFLATTSPPDPGASPVAGTPIVVNDGSRARCRIAADFDAFRNLFPPALCYETIVPVDEVITLTLHYREDDHLRRLMLDDRQAEELDRLWEELEFVSQDALTMVDAFQQLLEYASQDADPSVFEPLRGPIEAGAEAYRSALEAAQPRQLDAVIDFASLAYRRPLEAGEEEELRSLYRALREELGSHNDAIRLTLSRVLVSPAFLYRVERPGPGTEPVPVSSWELASRLSYFLWSSIPDETLRDRAESGELLDPDVLAEEARRMCSDDRVRRLAEEFACQWLQVYDFPTLDEKSERHFPSFADLRPAMYEETIRFFTALFREDQRIEAILDADYTFLNEDLARHYGIDGIAGPEWRRVDGVGQYGRGGILGLATTLSKQSGASRTSPILRGNWVSEVLLGERLPRPPKDVPRLPEDEAETDGLTVRELVERHTQDPRCARCHRRIDPFGFALERYDAIGRFREVDLGNRPIDTLTRLPDGAEIDGIEGLRRYLLSARRDEFTRQFCRKLLGYALGRGVQLSDEPLLDEMMRQLDERDGRVSAAIEAIVRSSQFREIRGRDFASAGVP